MKRKDIKTDDARLIFKFRTHMLNFATNYGHSIEDKTCPLCKKHDDDQDEVEGCEYLKEKFQNIEKIKKLYEEDEVPKDAIILLNKIIQCRQMKVDEENNQGKHDTEEQ